MFLHLVGGVISSKSLKQTVITHFMMNAEFVALDKCTQEVEYFYTDYWRMFRDGQDIRL